MQLQRNFCRTLALLTTLHLATSQRPDYNLPPGQVNRAFWWSSSAPLTRAVNELAPESIPGISLILYHAARVENAIIQKLKDSRSPKPDDIVKPCDPRIPKNYLGSYSRAFGLRGFQQPSIKCGAQINGVVLGPGEEPGYTLDEMYHAMFDHNVFIMKRLKEISMRVINNFTTPDLPFNFTYGTTSVICSQTPACLFRQHEHWYIGTGIHGNGKDTHVADGNQFSVLEFMRVVDGKLGDNLHLWLPVYDNGTVERVIRNDSTTMIQRWSTAPNPSCFREVPIDENAAVLDALDQADHSAQLAEDSLTRSNLAILLLPLGLNLIPIALITDVSSTTMLAYSLMSDVLTVLPLAIKGVELMIIGNKRWRSVVTRMTSEEVGNDTKPVSVGGEIWAAECKVRAEVRVTGKTLIVVSLVFLIFGLSSEFLARMYVKRWHKARSWHKQNGFGSKPGVVEGSRKLEGFRNSSLGNSTDRSFLDFVGTGHQDLERYSMDGKKEGSGDGGGIPHLL